MTQYLRRSTKWYVTVLLFSLLLLTGCVTAEVEQKGEIIVTNEETKPMVTPLVDTVSLTPEKIALATAPPHKPSSTPTAVVSSTFTPEVAQLSPASTTPSPTTVLTPTITPTITPLPTLSIKEEGEFLRMLMANNGGCDLPCWWGIIPGQTRSQEGRDLFASQGIDYWSTSFDNNYATMGLGYPINDNLSHSQDVLVRFELKDDVVQYIGVDAGYKHKDSQTIFNQDWNQYKLSIILSHYGIPSHVRLFHIGNSPYYHLGVSYISLGIEIRYIILPESLEKSRVCVDMEQTDFIALVLFPPEHADEIPGIAPNLDSYEMESWSSATGLDLESFYNIFIEDGACIEIN